MLRAFKSIPLTFYSRTFYANLVHKWSGIGIGFIILQILLGYAGPTLLHLPKLPEFQQHLKEAFVLMPDITIKNKKLSIDRPSPYAVDIFDVYQSYTILFDTNYQGNDLATLKRYMADKNAGVLLTADFVAVRDKDKYGPHVEIYEFSENVDEDFDVQHNEWVSFGEKAAKFFPFLLIFTLLPLFIIELVVTFFKGLTIKVLALFFATKLNLAGAMRLGVAASIPASVLGLTLAAVGMLVQNKPLAMPGSASLLIWLALVLIGLSAANKAAQAK